jgi:hypothetical protein
MGKLAASNLRKFLLEIPTKEKNFFHKITRDVPINSSEKFIDNTHTSFFEKSKVPHPGKNVLRKNFPRPKISESV